MAIEKNGFNDILKDFSEASEYKEVPVVPEASILAATPNMPPPPVGETEEPEEISGEELDANTEFALMMIEMGQEKGFEYLTKKKKLKRLKGLYGNDAEKRLEAALSKVEKNPTTSLSDDENGMLNIENKACEIIKSFPLSPKERETLAVPLKKWIKANGGDIPDSFWAMAAIMGVFGSRVMNIAQL